MVLTRLRMGELVNAWVGDDSTAFQIGLLAVFEGGPFAGPRGVVDADRVADELARRASGVPELTKRVLWTRLGEGRPVWVDDPDDRVEHHVATHRVPPGEDLATWAANRTASPLDLESPLWRADVVAGLPAGRFAVLLVVHHVLVDGLAGVRLLTSLLDAPDAVRVDPPPRAPGPLPSRRELVGDNLRFWRRRRAATPRASGRLLTRARRVVAQYREAMSEVAAPLPGIALSRTVGPTRRMSVTTVALEPLRSAARARGATVNDLLLAAVGQGMRDLLVARRECHESLFVRAIIPVALERVGQAASMMVVDLPAGEPDPARRLATIVRRTTARKARLRATGGTAPDLPSLPVPVARLVIPWARRRGSARIHLSVTNVPGPTGSMWFAGARLLDAVPIAPLVPLVPLTVAALSYAGRLTVAVNADGAIHDLDVLGDGIAASLMGWSSPGREPVRPVRPARPARPGRVGA